jgi:hypothetical protein
MSLGIFKEDITTAVKEFFRSGNMPGGINDTIIVLIYISYKAKPH